jgi:hypothetical protein
MACRTRLAYGLLDARLGVAADDKAIGARGDNARARGARDDAHVGDRRAVLPESQRNSVRGRRGRRRCEVNSLFCTHIDRVPRSGS